MLERNGLRHGGFELREDMANWKDGNIRGLRWNADSEILAIWIGRADEDVGKSALKLLMRFLLILESNYGR